MLEHEMSYGSWGRAIFRSVLLGFVLLVAYVTVAQIAGGGFYSAHENLLLLLMVGFVYFGLSILGWLLFGIPTHFVLCKWFSPRYVYYFSVCLIMSVFLVLFKGFSNSIVFVIAIFFQAALFRFYVFKKKHNKV